MCRPAEGGGVASAAESCRWTARRMGALLLAWLGLAGAAAAATLVDQVYAIAGQLMCPVCAGQTVAERDSALAREMRTIIRRRLEAGETRHQIPRYGKAQLGASLRAGPRTG